jgi:hypothetical protein
VWLPEVRPEEFLAGGRLAALPAQQRGAKLGDGGVDLPVGVVVELLPLGVNFGAAAWAVVAGG